MNRITDTTLEADADAPDAGLHPAQPPDFSRLIADGLANSARLTPDDRLWQLYEGEALAALMSMPDNSVDAVITDPPYSSGGFSRDDKNADPVKKYEHSGLKNGSMPTFGGDSRDQRSYFAWVTLWITEAVRVLKPSGYFMAFTDWRMLPVMSDAVQAGGVFWRGITVWDKGHGARAPHKGYFRHQCEYIIWGTKGAAPQLTHAGPFDGCMQFVVKQAEKFHLTGKPVAMMRALVQPVLPGGLILDPFAGSGSTGVAALMEGRRFIGIEREAAYAEIARARLQGVCANDGNSSAAFELGSGAMTSENIRNRQWELPA